MMAHVTGAEFFLKAERKALGGKKLSGLELPLRKKNAVWQVGLEEGHSPERV